MTTTGTMTKMTHTGIQTSTLEPTTGMKTLISDEPVWSGWFDRGKVWMGFWTYIGVKSPVMAAKTDSIYQCAAVKEAARKYILSSAWTSFDRKTKSTVW